jgi:hypothetical protein
MKAAALSRPLPGTEDNPFVKEALAEAQGSGPKSSVLDRLAALKK